MGVPSQVVGTEAAAAVRGPCYVKYTAATESCYVSQYSGGDRGVLLQFGQQQVLGSDRLTDRLLYLSAVQRWSFKVHHMHAPNLNKRTGFGPSHGPSHLSCSLHGGLLCAPHCIAHAVKHFESREESEQCLRG